MRTRDICIFRERYREKDSDILESDSGNTRYRYIDRERDRDNGSDTLESDSDNTR